MSPRTTRASSTLSSHSCTNALNSVDDSMCTLCPARSSTANVARGYLDPDHDLVLGATPGLGVLHDRSLEEVTDDPKTTHRLVVAPDHQVGRHVSVSVLRDHHRRHGLAHPRQVQIDPPPLGAALEYPLETPRHQPQIRAEPVQQQRSRCIRVTGHTVFHVVHVDACRSDELTHVVQGRRLRPQSMNASRWHTGCGYARIVKLPDRAHLLAAISAIERVQPRCGATKVVAIDGPSGAGKTDFAAALAARLPSAHILHMDDLYPGWDGLDQAVADLHDQILVPIARCEQAEYRRWDWEHDRYARWHTLPPTPLLLVEGVGSGAGRSAELESVLIWLEADRDVRFQRGVERDGEAFLPHWQRWAAQEDALFLADATRDRAGLIINTTP